MTVSISITRWALLGLLLVVMSCKGGTSGTGSPVVAVGSVTGFGSLVVNGITFDTTDAIITLNGRRGSEADLQLGHVVTVRGKLAPSGVVGTAETVTFETNAKGPIDSLDPADNSLVVLGQSVLVDDTTQFGATPFRALVVGNIVELSGFADTDGALRATRVEKTQDAFTPGTVLEVEGTITDLDREHQTFLLNTLQVDFSAAQLINLPGNRLRNGQTVEVTSTRNVRRGVLRAATVEAKAIGIRGNPGEAVELQGIITRVTSANTFEVNGQPVRITPTTMFERGTAADIAVNVRVEVEGFFNNDGIIVVEEVEFGAGIEIEGRITRVTSANTFDINGQPVRITPTTMFEGGTVDDIAVGVRVKVEGAFDEGNVFVATEIDFFVDEVEGRITRVTSANTFDINGQPVRITPTTMFEGGTVDDIAVGVLVEVEGLLDEDDVLVAGVIEFLP